MLEPKELMRDDLATIDQNEAISGISSLSAGDRDTSNEISQFKQFPLEDDKRLETHRENLNKALPAIYNNPSLSNSALNVDFGGLQHGTFLQATNKLSRTTSTSNISRPQLNTPASAINRQTQSELVGYGQLQNGSDQAKSVEVVYTLPQFESYQTSKDKVVLDGSRVNEFDGLTFKDENNEVVPGFDITYSYEGHDGEYSTVDTLKQRQDFSWDKVIAVMVFGVLEAHSSYHLDFPFKVIAGKNGSRTLCSLNEYALYDLETDNRVSSRLNFYVSQPLLSITDEDEVKYSAVELQANGQYHLVEELANVMPNLSDTSVMIDNFNNSGSKSEKVLWQGGKFTFDLLAIQRVISEYGYTVGVDRSGQNPKEKGILNESQQLQPIVPVHRVLKVANARVKAGSLNQWDCQSSVINVDGITPQNQVYPVAKDQVFIIDDTELKLDTAGNYTVKVGYYLNGSQNMDMLITQDVTVQVVENKQTINVYYIELPLNYHQQTQYQPEDGELLTEQTQSFTGNGDAAYQNSLWGPDEGYQIVSAEPGAKAGKFAGGQPAANYYVYLTHHQEQIIQKHTVKRTITVLMAKEIVQVVSQEGTIQRQGIYDQVTKEKTWQNWTSTTLPAFTPTPVSGYTIDQVANLPVTLKTTDKEVTIEYQPESTTVTIDFIDSQTNSTISSKKLTGLVGEKIKQPVETELTTLQAQGYTVVKETLPLNVRFTAGEQHYVIKVVASQPTVQNVTIYYFDTTNNQLLKEQTQQLTVQQGKQYHNQLWDYQTAGYRLIKADQGATSGEYFAGSDQQRYYVYLAHQVKELQDEHKVQRTINVVLPDNATQVVTQRGAVKRFGEHDMVTNSDQWTDWQAAGLPEYVPTSLKGYTISSVPAEQLSVSSQDSEVTIQYQPNPATAQVKITCNDDILLEKTLTGVTGQKIPYQLDQELAGLANQGYQVIDNPYPADERFAAGNNVYDIKLQQLVAVQPQASSTKEQRLSEKKGIFSALKGLF